MYKLMTVLFLFRKVLYQLKHLYQDTLLVPCRHYRRKATVPEVETLS